MKSVAIIGGGITGLTTAFRLKQNGITVTIYEADERVGGVIQSVRENGFLAEFGPNTCLETSPKITDLVRDLGLETRKLYTSPNAEARYVVRGGKPVLMPSSPARFFRSPFFSLGAKARIFAEPFIRRSAPNLDETLEQFVLRRLGREFLDYAINPMVAGIYAGDPARLSVRSAFPQLHALEQKYGSLILGQILGARERKKRDETPKQSAKKFSFDEGLQVLTQELHSRLIENIELQSPVKSVEETDLGWRVTSQSKNGERAKFHSAVLFTAPAHKLAEMELKTRAEVNLAALAKIDYTPIASVVFGFRREDVADWCEGFGALIPEVEKFNSLGVIFSSSLFPNRCPENHLLLTSYVGGARNPDLALAGRDVVREKVLEDLRRLLGVKAEPVFEHQCVFRKAIPQYTVGFDEIKNQMNAIEQKAAGIFIAGNFRNGISLSDSIVAGEAVCERISSFLKQQNASPELKKAA